MKHIILGAGKPHYGSQHSAIRFAGSNTRVLDWTLHAIARHPSSVIFVSGYQGKDIVSSYPEFSFRVNFEWEHTRAGWSLISGLPDENLECTVSYSDILFRPLTAKKVLDATADIVIAVDSHWRTRFTGRKKLDLERCEKTCITGISVTRLGSGLPVAHASAEFIGFLRLSAKAVRALRELKTSGYESFLRQASLSDLVELLRIKGLEVKAVDVNGDWAELYEAADLARFVLGTKAQTLARLSGILTHAQIEDQVSFTVGDWRQDDSKWISAVKAQFGYRKVIARSSALNEDGFYRSNAGVFTSILNIESNCGEAVHQAVEKVIASYGESSVDNEVLVQPMVANVAVSGVAFTRTLENGAPYYVVNYDDVSGNTESITSGNSNEHKTLVIRRDTDSTSAGIPPSLSKLLPALREIESLLGYDALDVEFAITEENDLYVLQVRPISVDHSGWGDTDSCFYTLLNEAELRFVARQAGSPFVCGTRTVFGVMPDWNPAEIIGTKPRQLATSLYRSLIMNDTWAVQRAEYGYRDVRPHPLLVSFAGHPYVDVRASLNSFIPAELPDELTGRIVDFCLDWLQARPELHDKVEFEVIPTCFSLDFARWEERFGKYAGLEDHELSRWRHALRVVTVAGMQRTAKDLTTIGLLENRYRLLLDSHLGPLEKACAMLEDARHYGTLPFAHLARSAFIAITLLRSAVATGVLSQVEMDSFLKSIRTVSHDQKHDALACALGELTWHDFAHRYGHLRPGTYEITSPSYKQDPERYLRPTVLNALNTATEDTQALANEWGNARTRFVEALNANDIPGTADQIETFLRQAIEGREYSKFTFTRSLSTALDLIREWGEGVGLEADVLAEVSIEDLRAIQSGQITTDDIRTWLKDLSNRSRTHRKVVDAIELPPLLCQREDFFVFQYPASQANFIGRALILAPCINLDIAKQDTDLNNKIVLIPQADPGYDWIFGRQIAGLITMYGGANSHMAIRVAEFGLAAAIGVGEVRYRALANAKEIELDPVNRTIRIIS